MQPDEAYRELLALYRERVLLESVSTALGWDEETYLPPGGVELRAEQQALLARLEHERASDARLGDLLDAAERASHAAGSLEAVNLQQLRHEHDRALATPASLVEELARATTLAQGAWEEARDTGDATEYLPVLERVVTLTQAWADCVRGDGSRYDACLHEWEPELDEREVRAVLDVLRPRLVALVDRVGDRAPDPVLERPLELDVQRRLGHALTEWLGFDHERGRLDEAAHPSTMWLGPGDVRLTTRYDRARPFAALYSTLHELGHGLYDQHLPPELFGTPAGEARSVALHESQARFVENVLGRSLPFVEGLLPRLQALAPAFADVTADRLYRALNHVRRTPERVSADEVTYDLHIAIRVELERALVAGELAVDDLPDAWDAAYTRDLVAPPEPALGLLQDGHWAAGMFGYFPTYTFGNVIAAQTERAARAALPELDAQLRRGELAPLVGWLAETIHRHAGRYPRRVLLARALGGPLDPEVHLARLEAKHRALGGGMVGG